MVSPETAKRIALTAAAAALSGASIYIASRPARALSQREKNVLAHEEQVAFEELRETNPEAYYDAIIQTQIETGQIGAGQTRCDELKQLAGRAASRGDLTSYRSDVEYAKSIGCAWALDMA